MHVSPRRPNVRREHCSEFTGSGFLTEFERKLRRHCRKKTEKKLQTFDFEPDELSHSHADNDLRNERMLASTVYDGVTGMLGDADGDVVSSSLDTVYIDMCI